MEDVVEEHEKTPRFDVIVPDRGYRWWYVDGISDDGKDGIVIIAFIGSVFSPYYFRAKNQGNGVALDHCAINVGLYRQRGKLWAMTERDSAAVAQSADRFQVGPSAIHWDAGRLIIDICERSMPFAKKLIGQLIVEPEFLNPEAFSLDPAGHHHWQPVSPIGRIHVRMQSPDVDWSGAAYFDTNWGSRPLEEDFSGWNWSRHGDQGEASITYAADLLDGSSTGLALDFNADGGITRRDVPPEFKLPGTGWRIDRRTRSADPLSVDRTLEDTPFYARSLLRSPSNRLIMHESLSLLRFRSGWVRRLLPFRMPRVTAKR